MIQMIYPLRKVYVPAGVLRKPEYPIVKLLRKRSLISRPLIPENYERSGSCCSALTVFAYTSRFRTDVSQCHIQQNVIFPVPTSDSSEIIRAALSGLMENWREGNFAFKKAGVVVWDILPDMAIQTNLFDTIDRDKQAALLKTIDEIKRKN